MKAIKINIPGCTMDLTPDDRPAVGVFGLESVGKTRFAATAPDPIGLLALDKKSKRTFQAVADELGKVVVVNEKPFMSDKESRDMAVLDDSAASVAKVKAMYGEVYKRVFDTAMAYATHPDIQSIVVDTNSQLFDWILFAHFGRKTQIKPTSRGAANQDLIDLVNALRNKNLVLIHRSKEIWKNTGATDRDGNAIQAPSGKFEQDGFKNIGGFLTVNCELTSKRTKTNDSHDKFRIRVVTCQVNAMLEGQDLHEYGVSGEDITFDNLMMAIGFGG